MRKMAAFLVSAIIIISLSACQKPPSQMDYDDLNNKIRQVYPSDNYISIDTKEETASVLASVPKLVLIHGRLRFGLHAAQRPGQCAVLLRRSRNLKATDGFQ